MTLRLLCALPMIAALSAQTLPSPAADLLVTNAVVRTLDAAHPTAEAVAVRADRILALGSNGEMEKLAGPGTEVIDARGALLLPGFNDAHVHFLSGGFQLSNIDLRDASSPAEFTRRLAEFAASAKGRWITGGDWDHERWPDTPLPAKEWVDAATAGTPVFVRRLDGHMALANTRALSIAGIDRHTPDPPGGSIVRDGATGEPTGILKDAAMSLVYRHVPPPTATETLEAARAASRYAASLGVTSVQDMSAGRDIGVYQQLLAQGELLTRIYAVSPLPDWQRWGRTGIRAPFGNSFIRAGGLKGFSDGSLGSTTALFFEPYADAPGTSGLPSDEMFPEGTMRDRVAGAAQAGLHVMIHAIGEKANAGILDIFEQIAASAPARDHRFRIEHAQHLRRSDIARFAPLGVIASMQPYHAADDGRWAEKRIGPERIRTTYAFRSLLDSGARLAFGSDWTVAPLNPLLGIHAAVTRQTLDGKHPNGWVPDEKISIEEAVAAYTLGSAFAEFAEEEKGSIMPGKWADLVLLDRDLWTVPPDELLEARVLLTVVNGKIVHRSVAF